MARNSEKPEYVEMQNAENETKTLYNLECGDKD
ncbi:hypothetical protein T02_9253 [Trichinella nativa]|uniref:Uncharacterized protein n=1 Tax=Trichinella nativa TaxID=6335 RepID=A0A0V1KGZ1_9BILA|nr:hypothetical protein T02_9253 [Trichinella nativa]